MGRKVCQQVYSIVRRRTMVARVGDRQLWKWCAFLLLGLSGYFLTESQYHSSENWKNFQAHSTIHSTNCAPEYAKVHKGMAHTGTCLPKPEHGWLTIERVCTLS